MSNDEIKQIEKVVRGRCSYEKSEKSRRTAVETDRDQFWGKF